MLHYALRRAMLGILTIRPLAVSPGTDRDSCASLATCLTAVTGGVNKRTW